MTVPWFPTPKFSLLDTEKVYHMQVDSQRSRHIEGMKPELRRARFWRELAQKYANFDLVRNIYTDQNNKNGVAQQIDSKFFGISILAILLTIFLY